MLVVGEKGMGSNVSSIIEHGLQLYDFAACGFVCGARCERGKSTEEAQTFRAHAAF